MKKTTFLLLMLAFVLSACGASSDEPVTSYPNPSYPNPSYPSPSESTSSEQAIYAPQPDDAFLTRGNVYIDSTDLLTLESFPLQFVLVLKGNLPTPCHQLRVIVNSPDAENKIYVEVYSLASPDRMCAQVLNPFDVNIPLGSFPSGYYILLINGEQAAEFEA